MTVRSFLPTVVAAITFLIAGTDIAPAHAKPVELGTTVVMPLNTTGPIYLDNPGAGNHWQCVAIAGTQNQQCTDTAGPPVPPAAALNTLPFAGQAQVVPAPVAASCHQEWILRQGLIHSYMDLEMVCPGAIPVSLGYYDPSLGIRVRFRGRW